MYDDPGAHLTQQNQEVLQCANLLFFFFFEDHPKSKGTVKHFTLVIRLPAVLSQFYEPKLRK